MGPTLKVADTFRTHEYSFKPGGNTVIAILKNGTTLEYDKVKYPSAYIKKVKQNPDVASVYIK